MYHRYMLLCKCRCARVIRGGFTLIELLVVIAIIGLLIAITVPSIASARESANRTVCAANLHSIGQLAHTFSADHNNFFPTAWSYGLPNRGENAVSYPLKLSFDENLESDHNDGFSWKRYGTPYQTFLNYAPSTKSKFTIPTANPSGTMQIASYLVCPSSDVSLLAATYFEDGWGANINISYMYIAGIPLRQVGSMGINHVSGYNWGTREPALKVSDPPNTVIAADAVYWGGGTVQGDDYRINHTAGNARVAASQNILYSDGRVENWKPQYKDMSDGSISTTLTGNNWSIAHEPSGGWKGAYFYFGQ